MVFAEPACCKRQPSGKAIIVGDCPTCFKKLGGDCPIVLAVQEKLEAFLAILQYKPPDG
jgi:hypothetical protein